MYIGLQDMFKVGIGPSSSHTVGPMRAARRFALGLPDTALCEVQRVEVELFGSLAHTGHGHGTDLAVLMGLCGEVPDTIDTGSISSRVAAIHVNRCLPLLARHEVPFDISHDLLFNRVEELPVHTNGMRFQAWNRAGSLLDSRELYSVGGGFVVDAEEHFVGSGRGTENAVPHLFTTMEELLERARQQNRFLTDLLFENECALHGEAATHAFIDRIDAVMMDCIDRGLTTTGTLPGGLRVQRRAPGMAGRLRSTPPHASEGAMNWVSAWAIAVNEENAAGGRVVTAPTNGAAGTLPAVLRYYRECRNGDREGIKRFFMAATAVGALCKRNASISGAEVGCQGEVGSAAAMAAAGLCAALGGSNDEIENAAEIALEHHLGMTCDPIGGLVQVPCIERNAMGAVKAINACSMAMLGSGMHMVTLDEAIETMRTTGKDMQSRYKETSLGGLAITVSVGQVEC
ncbi:MAG: L-serine ammonia-lyase [Brachymonas sp.]|nr:L-serine ammonia-lyase [Brachymonas sp.]